VLYALPPRRVPSIVVILDIAAKVMVSPVSIGPLGKGIYSMATLASIFLFLLMSIALLLKTPFSPEYCPKTYAGSLGGGTMIEVNSDFYGVFPPGLEILHIQLYNIIIEEGEDAEDDVVETFIREEEEREEDEESGGEVEQYQHQEDGVEQGSRDGLFSYLSQLLLYSACFDWITALVAVGVSLHVVGAAIILLAILGRPLCRLLMGPFTMKKRRAFRHSASKELRRKLSIPLGAVVWVGEVCVYVMMMIDGWGWGWSKCEASYTADHVNFFEPTELTNEPTTSMIFTGDNQYNESGLQGVKCSYDGY